MEVLTEPTSRSTASRPRRGIRPGCFFVLASLLLVPEMGVGSAGAQPAAEYVASPFRSLTKTRQLLDSADLRVMLANGYELRRNIKSELAARPGVIVGRVYTRARSGGKEERVEVVLAPDGAGGYGFTLYGERLRTLVADFRRMTDEAGRARRDEAPDVGYEMYRLGHIEADRALGILKALGYHTVEFSMSSKSKDLPIYEAVRDRKEQLPWIVKVVNATKTSLLQTDASGGKRSSSSGASKGKGVQGAPKLGGAHLHSATGGAPEQRLLLVFDRNDPEELEKLVNLLQSHVDLPAQQIVVEALVIEVNTSRLRSLGFELSGATGSVSGSFERTTGGGNPITTFLFSRDTFTDFASFKSNIEALSESGDAEILSSPSVLVLNDRQARIQVGRQIPIVRSTATTSTVTKGIEYFPIGIVLNLRPRINRENTEVTLQIETIISSISTESAAKLEAGVSESIEFAPIVDNRLVETYVRVADGTPFIIGGLLSTEALDTKAGVPFLSSIPGLGKLFSRQRVEKIQREVIVVITPHIVPLEDSSFSYLIPKDSDIFDRFDYRLYRNAYRVRDDDVWDLEFVRESPVLTRLLAELAERVEQDVMLHRHEQVEGLLNGQIPGEEVLVRRMLYEIVGNLDFGREIDLDQVFVFTPPSATDRGQLYSDDLVLSEALKPALTEPERTLVLTYEASPTPKPGHAFSLPIASVIDTVIAVGQQRNLLWDMNRYDADDAPEQWSITLANAGDVERLKNVLILKRVLDLNGNLAQTLKAFRPGVQILFPTRDDMRTRYHPIDREVAQLFFETQFPYQLSERIFNRTVRQVQGISGVSGE